MPIKRAKREYIEPLDLKQEVEAEISAVPPMAPSLDLLDDELLGPELQRKIDIIKKIIVNISKTTAEISNSRLARVEAVLACGGTLENIRLLSPITQRLRTPSHILGGSVLSKIDIAS